MNARMLSCAGCQRPVPPSEGVVVAYWNRGVRSFFRFRVLHRACRLFEPPPSALEVMWDVARLVRHPAAAGCWAKAVLAARHADGSWEAVARDLVEVARALGTKQLSRSGASGDASPIS